MLLLLAHSLSVPWQLSAMLSSAFWASLYILANKLRGAEDNLLAQEIWIFQQGSYGLGERVGLWLAWFYFKMSQLTNKRDDTHAN
tara:strand:- start:310 stop:564 length:255 start_codon:yes stop_codon:yes gene_type:complete